MTEDGFYFSEGTLHHNAPCYVERPADRELRAALEKGWFCYVLTARQMGKSSLMVRTAMQLRRKGITVATLDLTAVGRNVTEEQWYYGLLGRLGRQLGLKAQLETFWETYPQFGPVQRWIEAIQAVILPTLALPERVEESPNEDGMPPTSSSPDGQHASCVLFIDEIDVVRSLPFATDEFFAAIRECYNRRAECPALARLTFCLLGVASPTDLIQDTRTTPFNIGTRIELNDFTEQEARPLARGLCWDEQTNLALLRRVLYWTGGQPHLTQRLCAVLAHQSSGRVADVDALCRAFFLSPEARERDSNLLFVRERMLRSEGDLAGRLEIYARIAHGRLVRNDDTQPLLSVLRLSGITRVQDGHLQVGNRIYARVFDNTWIRESMPDAELRRQRRAFRQGLLRAVAVSAVIVAIIGWLAFANYRSARRADLARNDALARAREAEESRRQAKLSEANALQERQIALAAKDEAQKRATQLKAAMKAYRRETGIANANAHAHDLAAARAQTKTVEANHALFMASMNLAAEAWANNDAGRTQQVLDKTRNDPNRGFEWDYLEHLCHQEQRCFSFPGESVQSVQYSADGKRLLILTDANKIRILDLASGKVRLLFQGGMHKLSFAEISPDGKCVATRIDHVAFGELLILDAETGKTLCKHQDSNPYTERKIRAARFAPDSKTLIIAANDKIEIWNSRTGEILREIDYAADIVSIDVSRNGKHLAVGGWGHAGLFALETGKRLQTFDDPQGYAAANISIFPSNPMIIAGPLGKIWDTTSGQYITKLKEPYEEHVNALGFSPDGKFLATCEDQTVYIRAVATGIVRTIRGFGWRVNSVCFSPDGKMLATGSADSTVRLWNVVSPDEPREIPTWDSPMNAMEISPDGKWLATGNESGKVALWDMETGKLQRLFFYDKPVPEASINRNSILGYYKSRTVRSLSISPDHKWIAVGGEGNMVQINSAATGKERMRLQTRMVVQTLCFTPDGKRLVTGGRDHLVKLWDISAAVPRLIRCFPGHTDNIYSVCVSPEGKRLLTAGEDHTARIWDLATGHLLRVLRGHQDAVTCAHFSHDGRHIVTSSWDETVKVWSAATGILETNIQAHVTGALSACFSPDDHRILTAGNDKMAKLWDVVTGQELLAFRGHGSRVVAARFSPDGKRIVTAGYDTIARIWSSVPTASVFPAVPGTERTRLGGVPPSVLPDAYAGRSKQRPYFSPLPPRSGKPG